ncbi:hypothetical protein M426DRAFT_22365 [Hypoxylon sp. CI-4A]|nr:hypothetical protein M426DRAFT_22365 [Hypoxylon sp. CI-4A]
MPGEEMEITTDFGHTAFGEDIDIDLDFAVGQPDEDLELADFDQAQEMQNFNSDTRDELMAEGDDASYGMIDADEVEHNETATAANDIEIDLGDSDEHVWQHDATQDATQEETFATVAEIDYVETTDLGDTNTQHADNGDNSWVKTSAYSINKPNDVTEAGEGYGDAEHFVTTEGSLLQDDAAPSGGIETQDFGVAETKEGGVDLIVDVNNIESLDDALSGQQDGAPDASIQQSTADPTSNEQQGIVEDDTGVQAVVDIHGSPTHEAETGQDPSGDAQVHGSEYDQINADEHGDQAVAPVASDHDPVDDQSVEQRESGQHESVDLAGSEQLGNDFYTESTNDQNSFDQASQQGEAQLTTAGNDDEIRSHSDADDSENRDSNAASIYQEEHGSQNGAVHVEHPLSVATRHEMYISYGQTDYRLFAKSKDDDPNQYFLRDMSALEQPLGQFLSNLREVIADEVSPLDELVMHVDGLGLEFSESSSSDMLDNYTFGDILGLYDRLLKNEGTEVAPDLFTYLMVKPSCHQRYMALLESANSGRGLSEVAVYREGSNYGDDNDGEPHDYTSYISPESEEGEETHQASNSPVPGEEDDGVYEYEDHDRSENDYIEHNDEHDEAEDGAELNSPSAQTPVTEANTVYPTEQAEDPEDKSVVDTGANTEENTVENTVENTDGFIDYSDDDELDLSSSKQGNSHLSHITASIPHSRDTTCCLCEACFDIELEELDASWEMCVSAPAWSSSPSQVQDSEQASPMRSSAQQLTNLSSQQDPYPGHIFQNLRIDTNSYLHKDQQADASLQGLTEETQTQENPEVVTKHEQNDANHHTPTNGSAEAPNSDATSVTATLTGDDKDEIDYSDDDGNDFMTNNDSHLVNDSDPSATLQVPVEDEITWESDNEDANDAAPKQTVQVSPSAKRPRSDSDLLDGENAQNDYKRRRPS